MNEIAVGELWRHKKRGSTYKIIEIDAVIQCADLEVQKYEGEDWVAYQHEQGGRMFFRLRQEFLDGRFEKVML